MKKAKLVSILVVCAVVSSLSGCASIVDGVHQSVSVQTLPATGATCSLQNNKGTWYVNRTPGSVVIHKSYKDLQVSCQKRGYRTSTLKVQSHTKAMAFGNAIIGGVIGAGVDIGDGAAYSYPNLITVPMGK